MKIFRYVINTLFILAILYVIIMNFMLYDTSCDHLKDGLIRGFYFLGELFIYGFAITFILNILNERKIEKQN